MRPTLKQVYNDPYAIVAALEAAGVQNAHAKVFSMMNDLVEYWSMHRYYDRLYDDRTSVLQSHERRMRWPNAQPDRDQILRDRKQASDYHKTIIVARGYLRRKAKAIEARIAKWPDLAIDPQALRKRPDSALVKKLLKKRMRKSKPRTIVLG